MTSRLIKQLEFRVSIFALISLFVFSCSENNNSAQQVIRVGVLINDTTPGGVQTLNATKLFIEEQELEGESPDNNKFSLEIIPRNIDLQPEKARHATRDLIFNEKVDIVVGPNVSISAIAASTVCELAEIPMISPGATNAIVSLNKSYIFQVAFNDREQGNAISSLLVSRIGLSKVGVIYQISNPASREVAESFIKNYVKAGGSIHRRLAYSSYNKLTQEKIKQLDVKDLDWVLLPNLHQQSMEQAAILREIGFSGKFVGSDSWSPMKSQSDTNLQNSILSQHWFHASQTQTTRSIKFTQSFLNKFNTVPTSTAALTYDTLGLVKNVVKDSIKNKSGLRDEIKKANYQGVTGEISFNKNKRRTPVFLEIKNNTFTELSKVSVSQKENMP